MKLIFEGSFTSIKSQMEEVLGREPDLDSDDANAPVLDLDLDSDNANAPVLDSDLDSDNANAPVLDLDLDSNGVKWDKNLHSKGKTKLMGGEWRPRKNVVNGTLPPASTSENVSTIGEVLALIESLRSRNLSTIEEMYADVRSLGADDVGSLHPAQRIELIKLLQEKYETASE